eukprot:753477-Hanusia_phi.AAC.2
MLRVWLVDAGRGGRVEGCGIAAAAAAAAAAASERLSPASTALFPLACRSASDSPGEEDEGR